MVINNTSTSTTNNTNNKGETKMSIIKMIEKRLEKIATSSALGTYLVAALATNLAAGALGLDHIGEDDLWTLEQLVTESDSASITLSRKLITFLGLAGRSAETIANNHVPALGVQRILKAYMPNTCGAVIPGILCLVFQGKAPAWAQEPFKLDHEGYQRFLDLPTSEPNPWKVKLEDAIKELPLVDEKGNYRAFTFKSFGNPNAQTKLTVKYTTNSLGWFLGNDEPKELSMYSMNSRLVRVQNNYKFEGEKHCFSKGEATLLISDILRAVAKKDGLRKAQNFLQALVGTVLVSEWEASEYDNTIYNEAAIQPNVANLVDAQKVLRDNEVVVYHVNKAGELIIRAETETHSNWVEGCLEAASRFFGFCLPDKTNTKRAFAGDAVTIMGFSANGTVSMVGDNKGGKFFNRPAMVKHISAEVVNPELDALMAEMSEGKLAANYGTLQNSLFLNAPLLSMVVGDGGFVVRKPLVYKINKRLQGTLNIDLVFANNEEYKAIVISKAGLSFRQRQVSQVISDVRKFLETKVNTVLSPGEAIEWNGQKILLNSNNMDVVIIDAKVSEGVAINTEVRTLKVTVKAKATVEDYNYKARGQGLKGMATRNDDVVVEDAESADVIFNDNSVKNRKSMLIRMWANATNTLVAFCKDGEFRYVEYNEDFDIFEIKGLVDFNEVQTYLDSISKIYPVKLKVNRASLKRFKKAKASAFDPKTVKETIIDSDYSFLEFGAEGIQAPLVYAVELSSVQENFTPDRLLSPIQSTFLTTFKGTKEMATRAIGRRAKQIARTIELASSTKVDGDFKLHYDAIEALGSREVLAHILTSADKKGTARDMFRALAQKFPNGIKISGATDEGKRPWSVILPFHILSVQGRFDKSGYSYDERINNVYAFLSLLKVTKLSAPAAQSQLIADYAIGLGKGLDGWRSDIVNSNKGFTKGATVFNTHGMKVLSSQEAVHVKINGELIPTIILDESNPLVTGEAIDKDGEKVKVVKDGDVVFFYRNPMIDLTPAIIRVTKNQSICSKYTCATSADVLAYSSQTDNDGDTLWIVPASQVGIGNVYDAERKEINLDAAAELMQHPLVNPELAENTMEAFGCENLLEGILKEREEFSVLNPCNSVTIDVITEAEKVAHHYRIRVGQGYSAMFNAYSTFIRKYNEGYVFTDAELVGIKGCSFVLYEEWGLAGYTESNEDNFKIIYTRAKVNLGRGKAIPTNAGNRFKKSTSSQVVTREEALGQASKYVAQQMLQSELARTNKYVEDTDLTNEALVNGLFRSLTKSAVTLEGNINPIFLDGIVDSSNPYAVALTAWKSFNASIM
jgi:hypothetical protein